MNVHRALRALLSIPLVAGTLFAPDTAAQGYDTPLTIQGLDHTTSQSAASRAFGGVAIGFDGDASTMFLHPANLQSLDRAQIAFGGVRYTSDARQEQQYAPLKYYSNFSLLMEGLTGHIPNPDTSLTGVNAGDTVQRPFDTIGPNWSRSERVTDPLQALAAVPFRVGEMKFAGGIGFVQYADLHHYYQNNNVLNPSILSERPYPVPRPPTDSIPVVSRWSQYSRFRDGSIRGYGGALSAALSEKLVVGLSGLILKGSSDDFEQQVSRGNLTFYTNFFKLDSVHGVVTKTGTSDYSGQEFTLSARYRGEYVSAGFSVRPPTTITRTFTTSIRVVDGATVSTSTAEGKDKLKFPWRGGVGLLINPAKDLLLGLEYEIRAYASAVYTQPDGVQSKPWLSASVFHIGLQYEAFDWLTVRGGIRGQAEVFEPEGNFISGEPVSYSIYSGGVGLTYADIRLDVTYEYGQMKYQDVWGSAVSLNTERRHSIVVNVLYNIRWDR
jgi:opacity protein-like surface antigen